MQQLGSVQCPTLGSGNLRCHKLLGGVARLVAGPSPSLVPGPANRHGRLAGSQSRLVTNAKPSAAPSDLSSAPDVSSSSNLVQPAQQDASEQLLDHTALIRNLEAYDDGQSALPSTSGRVEVPHVRLITDPRELDLIGDGLPVVFGVSKNKHRPKHTAMPMGELLVSA